MRAAVAAAAARATGAVALAIEERAELGAACTRTGRAVVDLGDGTAGVTWESGYEPNLAEDPIEPYQLPPTRLVALGIAITLCRQEHRGALPGRIAAVSEFDAMLDRLRASRDEARDGGGQAHHVKGALVDLHEMGYLRYDGERITLGPALAAMTPRDWAVIDEVRPRLLEDT